jgi:membrane protein implicated in regulation of membrane protease activity
VSEPERSNGSDRKYPTQVLITVGILLAAPIVALMWVSSYNSDSPRLWGFPFFYWYQFLWVLVAAGTTYLAFVLLSRAERRTSRRDERNEGQK